MYSTTELRAELASAGRVSLVLGPLGKSPAVLRWLAAAAPKASIDVLDVPPTKFASTDRVIDLRMSGPEFLGEWFGEVFPGSDLARQLAPAGQLIEEALSVGITSADDPRISETAGYSAVESAVLSIGGRGFLDFARVLMLVYPRPLQIGDEWVTLVNRMVGARWSIADLAITLKECSDWFAFGVDEHGADIVSFASPFIARIASSDVDASTSEHYLLYRALREMAVGSISRHDPGNLFVAKELPHQALEGEAVDELCSDGMAILAADPKELVRVIERSGATSRGPKLVLRAAHRLGEADSFGWLETLSQVELAARRSSMLQLAEQIRDGSPPRPWEPMWSTSQPVNTNRVLFSKSASVRCLAANPSSPDMSYFAGLSDGSVWEISPDGPKFARPVVAANATEALGMATISLNGKTTIFAGFSDGSVHAYDAQSGESQWTYGVTGPVGAIAASAWAGGGVLAVGGVDGTLALFDAITREPLVDQTSVLADTGVFPRVAEIRGINLLDSLMVVCVSSGHIVGFDCTTGKMLWRALIPSNGEVCNCVASVYTELGLEVVVGTSGGEVYYFQPTEHGSAVNDFSPVLKVELGSAVNALSLRAGSDGLTVFAALSNSSWVKGMPGQQDGTKWSSYLGHVGPINALLIAETDGGRVITGSGEGTIRTWLSTFVDHESAVLEWGIKHRGAVTGMSIDFANPHNEITHVTGGNDGTMRVWFGSGDTVGVRIASHDAPIRAICWDPSRETAYVGHVDGALWKISRSESVWTSVLLGIQHDGVRALALSPDGALYSTGVDGTVAGWPLEAGKRRVVSEQIAEFGFIGAIGWLSGMVVVGAQDGSVSLLDSDTLELKKKVSFDSSVLCLAAYDHDLFVGFPNGEVAIVREFDGSKKLTQTRIQVHDGEVRGIQAFELGGNLMIATTGLDRRIRVTDALSLVPLADIAMDGFGLSLHADPPYVAASTTSGAMAVRLSDELSRFNENRQPLHGEHRALD